MAKVARKPRFGVTSENVFSSLFPFRPRKDTTSKENFLTESLIYTMRADKRACTEWLRMVVVDQPTELSSIKLTTRKAHVDESAGTRIYPDVRIDARTRDGRNISAALEHKWDSPYNQAQLDRYSKISGIRYLALFCEKISDIRKAKTFKCRPSLSYGAHLWEDLYRNLARLPNKSRVLTEFLYFMDAEGLSPGRAISLSSIRKGVTSRLLGQMERYCEKLSNEYRWSIPNYLQRTVSIVNSYGRCGLVFSEDDGWAPAVVLGFYYDTTDHRLPFVNPRMGFDIHIRIQANPKKNRRPEKVLSIFQKSTLPLRKNSNVRVFIKGDKRSNPHTLLMIQRSLVEVVSPFYSEVEQIDAIHKELDSWCKIIFSDRRLRLALKNLAPYGVEY